MKSIRRICTCWALAALVVLAVNPAWAQSPNSQAVRWFKLGLSETDPQKKIVAYTQAVELDPLFVEALFNLGVAHKKQGDYVRAEQVLLKALNARPNKIENDTKAQILSELATTYEKMGKPKDCKATLRQVKSLTANPKKLALISFALGRLLYEQGRYQECLAELQEGEKLNPAIQGDFTKLIQSAASELSKQELQQGELERLYAAAEKAQATGNWRGAKALYEQIRAKNAAYKNVDSKTAELDSLLNAETKKTNIAALYDQAVKQAGDGNLDLAIAGFENVLQQSGGNYKDAKTRVEAARQQLTQKQLNDKLESEYTAGMASLRVRNWTRAILAFENVQALDKNYRDARKRLSEAQNGIERESAENIVARYYADGVASMNKGDIGGAVAAFEKARRINPNYRDLPNLLAEVENALQKRPPLDAKTETPAPAVVRTKLDTLYQLGVAAAASNDWMQAVVNFEKVQFLQTNYRDVSGQLAQARAHLTLAVKTSRPAQTASGSNVSFYFGSVAALIVLPLLGFAAFSPATRARLHLMRGNYADAAQIYEKWLGRHPDKVKHYAALANIYLLLGRHDDNALKAYKMVLQLNLTTTKRDEMSTIVAQNYLTEGRTDSDAIEVLESALRAEQRRQQQG